MAEQNDSTERPEKRHQDAREVLDQLMPLVYEELKRVASQRLLGERRNHTLVTTDLVHETYLKLAGLDRIRWEGRAQFFALAAGAMRRILVDHAVRVKTQKRGGGRRKVPLDQVTLPADYGTPDLLALNAALERLAARNERQCRVVECRYFAGMNIEETAEALATSPATVKRDWTVARAWLHRELGG